MTSKVSDANRRVAHHAATAFGGGFQVREYLDDASPLTMDILWCDDRPCEGVTSYSTVGLSDLVIPMGEGEFPVRIELAMACASALDRIPNILASAAFRMIRTGEVYHPGVAIEGPIDLYLPSSPLPYLYFTHPNLWEGLTTIDVGSKRVTWLLAMPISATERQYLRQRGDGALEALFEEHQIDVFDVHRPSVV